MVYDIMIIGAGPAGSTFARCTASKGKSILLIDGQSEANKKPCGGLLAPDAQKALARFDFVLPKDILSDPQIFSVKTIDLQTKRIRCYQRYYLNMDRYAFDKHLLSLVPKDVEIVSGRCNDIKKEGDLFTATVFARGERRQYQARTIVGADGANSIVRRKIFNAPIMQYVSIQQWFSRGDSANPFYSCIFDPQTSESCSWLMYKGEYMIFGGCFERQNCRAAFEEQKIRLQEFLGQDFGEPVKTEACLADRPRRMKDFVTGKDGAYLIGEAAGFISASSFEGISSAILSGKYLAEAMHSPSPAKAYRKSTAKLRLKLYLKTIKRWFMYTPWVRNLIMTSGVMSIKVEEVA